MTVGEIMDAIDEIRELETTVMEQGNNNHYDPGYANNRIQELRDQEINEE